MKSAGVLLVEGKSDEEFYNAICERYDFKARVKVAPPRPLGGKFNNKEGLFSVLPLQLAQLADASLERLAIVVDADFPATHGLGFARTYDRVKTIVSEYGFNPVKRNGIDGLLFASSEGFHDIVVDHA